MKSDRKIFTILLLMAVRNLTRNWRHSLAALLSISAGFAAIALFDGYLKHIENHFENQLSEQMMFGHAIIQAKGADAGNLMARSWKHTLDKKTQGFVEDYLAGQPNVRERMRVLQISGMAQKAAASDYFIGMGFDLQAGAKIRGEMWNYNAIAGTPLHLSTVPRAIAVGQGMARTLGCAYSGSRDYMLPMGNYLPEKRPLACEGNAVTLSVTTERGRMNTVRASLGAIIDGGIDYIDRRLVTMALEDAQKLMNTDRINHYIVLLDSPEQAKDFIAGFNAAAARAGFANVVAVHAFDQGVGKAVLSLIGVGRSFKYVFLIIIIVIGGMTVSNTISKAVRERVSEIGTLRSLGFFQRHVVWLFSLEALVLGVVSSLAGMLLTGVVMGVIAVAGLTISSGILVTPVPVMIMAAPFAWTLNALSFVVLTAVTGLRVSYKFSRMVVADAMRSVE